MAYLGNPKHTIAVLQKYNFSFQKKFGQNFLIDPHVLDKIISAAQIQKDDFVLEIGPGIGTMTQYLCEHAREVAAVGIDQKPDPHFRRNVKRIPQCRSDSSGYLKNGSCGSGKGKK